MFGLPRTVVALSFVSLLNDAASDMIAPLLPLFLVTALGAGPAIIGLIEGVAEATASLLKLISGRLTDRGVRPHTLVVGGYTLSNVARPLIGLAIGWPFVLLLRFMDRIGKGLRSAPRDAMIAAVTPAHQQGAAFGFHRALDNGGAVIGPLMAFALLAMHVPLAQVFLFSAVFGVLVLMLLAFGVDREAGRVAKVASLPPLHWRLLDSRLKGIIIAASLLAVSAIPEVFLVLWARDHGLAIMYVPLIWAAASLVKMLVAVPAGRWSDRVGRLPVLLTGWILRILMLLALAWADNGQWLVWAIFLGYAGSLAFTEGAERALIAEAAAPNARATAYGIYYMSSGLMALPGAVMIGWIWEKHGAAPACVLSAGLAAIAATIMLRETMLTKRSA